MTFLANDAQKNLFIMQKSQLQFERNLVANRASMIAKTSAQYAASCNGENLENDPYFLSLEREEEFLGSRKDALESQMQLLDAEIGGLKQLVNNNIKNGCGLNLIGG